jgi:5-methylcytosine-specific restriction endonuclease McrA
MDNLSKQADMTDRTCSECGAGGKVIRGLCRKHYQQLWASGAIPKRVKVDRRCDRPDCDEPHLAKGLCKRHYRQEEYQQKSDRINEQARAWREVNREHVRQRSRDYYQQNAEKIREQDRTRHAANPQPKRDKERRYRERNPETVAAMKRRWAQENAEALAAYWAEYQRQNRMKRRASNALRKAWLKSTQVEPVSYERVVAMHGMTCHLCGEQITSEGDLHIDHVIPRERGGTHTYGNLRPAHALCNLRKGTKLMSELTWAIRAS